MPLYVAQYRSDSGVSNCFNKESSIQKPSLTPIEYDSVWVDTWPLESDNPNGNLYTGGGSGNPAEMDRCCIPRHGWNNPSSAPQQFNIRQLLPGGIDVGCFDGHVQYAPLETLWSYSWHLNWVPAARHPAAS